MIPTSLWQIFLTCAFMFVLLIPLSNKSFSKDLTLEEVVEAVNFSRRVIEDGELQLIYTEAPKPERLSEDEMKSLEADVAQWKEKYKMTERQQEKHRIREELDAAERRLEYSTKGRVICEQRNIVFQVKVYAASPNPSEDLYFRIHMIDRHDEYEGDLGVNSSYIELLDLPTQYHNTVLYDGEHTIYLWADVTGSNTGLIDNIQSAAIQIPYHLWGRSYHEIVAEKVRDFNKEIHQTSAVYTIELELERDLNELATASGLSTIDRVTQRVWVDSQQGFSVIRLEIRLYVKGNFTILQVCRYGQFREFRGGIWFPATVENTIYDLLDPTKITDTFSYEIQEAEFNIGIPSDFFNGLVDEGIRLGLLNYSQNGFNDSQDNQ